TPVPRIRIRRRADAFELFDRRRQSGGTRPREDDLVGRALVAPYLDDLLRANVRVEQVGPSGRHRDADHRAHRMAEQQDLLLSQVPAEEFRDLGAIARNALERHLATVLAIAAEGLADTAPIPLHQREVLLPVPEPGREGEVRGGR